MSYQIGQFRKSQMNSYFDDYTEYIEEDIQESERQFSNDLKFENACGNIEDSAYALKSQNYYYLRFKVKQRSDSEQNFYLKLRNNISDQQQATDNFEERQQIIDDFIVRSGNDESVFEVIIAPNTTYNQILFQLQRTVFDYRNEARVMEVEIECYAIIKNVINEFLKRSGGYTGLNSLTKIGIQGPPSLLMCINGEQIRIGKSGIYEINNGIAISFIGFIPREDEESIATNYFIMDFEYIKED